MKSGAMSSMQFAGELENLHKIQQANCPHCGRHAQELLVAKQNVMQQMIRFQKVVQAFESDVKMANLNQEMQHLNGNGNRAPQSNLRDSQALISQANASAAEIEELKKKLKLITDENIEFKRLFKEMQVPQENKSCQTIGPLHTREIMDAEAVFNSITDHSKAPYTKYIRTYEQAREAKIRQSYSNDRIDFKSNELKKFNQINNETYCDFIREPVQIQRYQEANYNTAKQEDYRGRYKHSRHTKTHHSFLHNAGSRDNSGHRPLKSFSDSQRDFQPTSSQMEPKQVSRGQDEHQPRYDNYDSRNNSRARLDSYTLMQRRIELRPE